MNNAIKAIEAEQETKSKETSKEISDLKTLVNFLEGKGSEQQVLKFLCWKSLAYCCSLERKCIHRDIALEVLGISKETYAKIKKDTHIAFMEQATLNRIHEEDYKTEKTAREAE